VRRPEGKIKLIVIYSRRFGGAGARWQRPSRRSG